MVSVKQDVVAVGITIIVSLLAMVALNRLWPMEKRRQYNDLIGWQLTILGTTYAVILGFMIYAVWTNYDVAEHNVDLEANSVVNLYRLADGLPENQRTQLQTLARAYADTVISQEWPQMARGEVPEQKLIIKEMWKTVMSVKAESPTEVSAQEHTMAELESLAQYRLTRITQSRSHLPTVLWWVLIVGGCMTILSACTFAEESIWLQMLHVFFFSLLVSLSLVSIANIHRPFYGLIHVSDYAFQRARQVMQSP